MTFGRSGFRIIALAVLALAAGAPVPVSAADVGVLTCRSDEVDAAVHFGANRKISCTFVHTRNRKKESYKGNIRKFGVEVGIIGSSLLTWQVTSKKRKKVRRGALAGTYTGVTAEASVGTGFAANLLTGGPDRSYVLQPFAVHGQTGLNVTAGMIVLTLKRRK